MRKVAAITLLTAVLFLGLIGFKFGSALFQEGNPVPILIAVMQLELSDRDWQKVLETTKEEQYVAKYKPKSQHAIVKKFMEGFGWTFQEQIGSGLIFTKDKQAITVETRLYSKHYFLWTVPKDVILSKN